MKVDGVIALAFSVISGGPLIGCYKYAVAQRTPPPEYKLLDIDPNDARTFTQWSFVWGLSGEDVIAPLECVDGKVDQDGKCTKGAKDLCFGKPIARYETVVPFYSSLFTVASLGLVSMVQLNVWCSNYSPARSLPNANSSGER